MNGKKKVEKFYVLYCSEDDSHVVVEEESLLFDEYSLCIGDTVNFFYPGVKRVLEGTVKGFSENFDEMTDLQDKLNAKTKPKRDVSFHEERPRAAALRCKQAGFKHSTKFSQQAKGNAAKPDKNPSAHTSRHKAQTSVSVAKNGGIDGKLEGRHKPVPSTSKSQIHSLDGSSSDSSDSNPDTAKVKEKVNQTVQETSSTGPKFSDTSDSDSNESLNEEELTLLRKIAEKKKTKELKSLVQLNLNAGNIGSSSLTDSKQNTRFIFKKQGVTSNDSDRSNSNPSDASVDYPKSMSSNSAPQKSYDAMGSLASSNTSTADKVPTDTLEEEPWLVSNDKQPEVNKNPLAPTNNTINSHGAPAVRSLVSARNHSAPTNNSANSHGTPGVQRLKSVKALKAALKRKRQTASSNLNYDGEFFNYSEKSNVQTVKLIESYDVWVSYVGLRKIKKKHKTPTSLARALMREVFTEEARLACSVSGKAHTTSEGSTLVRPALDQLGIEAILDFVTARSEKKTWAKTTDTALKQAMRNLLSEERLTAKL